MAFIDEVSFHAKAGRGGSGVVRWLHEKGKEFMGPAGGNGVLLLVPLPEFFRVLRHGNWFGGAHRYSRAGKF